MILRSQICCFLQDFPEHLGATRLLVCRVDEGHRPEKRPRPRDGLGGFFTGSDGHAMENGGKR